MIVNYGSLAHIISVLLALAICAAFFLFLRGKSRKIQISVIYSIMALNIFQHLFKSYIYPQYAGLGFTSLNTAYNMCATLILISPLAMLIHRRPIKNFVFYIGSVAGMIAIVIPYWSIGKPASDPDFIRSFICHAMLFLSSMLPLLLGIHKPKYKCAFELGVGFLAVIGIIIFNDVLCLIAGIYPGVEGMTVLDALYRISPVWSFGPPEEFSWVLTLADAVLPSAWTGHGGISRPIPVLWYAIPLYIGITLIALPITIAADYKSFKQDMERIFRKKSKK